MRTSSTHIARNVAILVAAFAALVAAGWIVQGGGFAFAIGLMLAGAIALAVPFVAVYLEERGLPRDPKTPRA